MVDHSVHSQELFLDLFDVGGISHEIGISQADVFFVILLQLRCNHSERL